VIKILLKALILVCIILSIYIIVNPSACSNLINGRVVNSMETVPVVQDRTHDINEMFTPVGDKKSKSSNTNTAPVQNTEDGVFTQEDADYATAFYYVELENQYANEGKDLNEGAQEIAYKVMTEFELTPKAWDAFLQRATASNLFDKVRADYAAQEKSKATAADANFLQPRKK